LSGAIAGKAVGEGGGGVHHAKQYG
jgi:hypothetical protein